MKSERTIHKSSLRTLFVGLSVLAGGLGCTAHKQDLPPIRETVSNVSVLVAQKATVPDYVEAVGTVRAAQTSQLASQIMGTITSISVQEGDRVHRGQILAVIDEAQQRAGVERASAGVRASQQDATAAEADFTLAESTLKRYQSLFDKKSLSPQEFDEVKTRYAAAQARRDSANAGRAQAEAAMTQAKTSLDYTRVRAPFDGIVTAKLVDVGSMATPGMPIVVIEDPTRFRLEATVDESAIGVVRLGQVVPVTLDSATGKSFHGKVVQVLSAADPASRTFLVKIELPKTSDLRSGVFGRARFPRGQRDSLLIPGSAVLDRGQLKGVYVVGSDQIASLRYITLGKTDEGRLEVLSGLESGERIVAEPGTRDLDGRKIEMR
jgi:membrane fusion protein, multidrug efflux system